MHRSPLCKGRPEKGSRSPAEEKCYELLDALAIDYVRVDHDAAMSMEELEPIGEALGCPVAKNLFLTNRRQSRFYLLVMPGDKPFKTKYLSAQLGCSRLSFAPEEQLERLLGVKSGSASLLALAGASREELQPVLDADILRGDKFACHPCLNSTTLAFSTQELREKLLPALGFEAAVVDLPREFE